MKNLDLFNSFDRRPGLLFSDFDREIERLFDLYSPSRVGQDNGGKMASSFTPMCDLLDRESHYIMSFDVPGVKKGDIKVEVNDRVLTVEGERKFEHRDGDYAERRSGHFKRMVQLPDGIEPDNVEAKFEDGVLSIAIPKAEKSKPKEVTISEGKKSGVWNRLLGFGQTTKEEADKDTEVSQAS